MDRIRKFITLNYLISFLSVSLPAFHSLKNSTSSATCGHPFHCANIHNITYPFWKQDSPNVVKDFGSLLLCGHPNFALRCHHDDHAPLISISQLPYRVLDIDFFSYTLKVARHDLWNNLCSPIPVDTMLNDTVFNIPADLKYTNVTLYYNCTGNWTTLSNNQFTCGVGEAGNNLFEIEGGVLGPQLACARRITVPVNESTAASGLGLRDALAGGFTIQWSADNAKCLDCLRLGGACAYDNSSSRFYCEKLIPRQEILYPRVPPLNSTAGEPKQNSTASDRPEQPKAIHPPGTSAQPDGDYATTIPPPKLHIWPSTQKSSIKFELALVLATICSTLAIILIAWCCCKVRSFPRARKDTTVEKFLLQHGSLAPKRYKYFEIKKITQSFSDKLGQGGYGSVYKGTLRDGSTVAVKVLINTDSNDEEFINEVASISRTSHVNIVSLLGFCYERNKRALVYEFMPNNSLDKYIGDADTSLDMDKLYEVAVGVAKGLEYLHKGCNTKIIHFDIKPQNILLDECFCPKISDFGLAKLCKKKQSILSVLGTRGTAGYIAPEVFYRNFGKVSHKSDVYSYGIMILEMAGARKFVEAETIQSCENFFPDKIYEQTILGHVLKIVNFKESIVEQEDEKARKMFLVGFWCIQTMPSDRPSMSKVVEMLEGNVESIQVPPKPFLFNPKLMRQEFSTSLSVQCGTENFGEYK